MSSRCHLLLCLLLAGLLFTKQGWAGEDYSEYNDDEPEDEDGEEEEEVPVSIISQPLNLTLKKGATAVLPCTIDNLQEAVVQWRKGDKAIYFDGTKQIDDPRYNRAPNNTLFVRNINKGDQDIFSCQLITTRAEKSPGTTKIEHRVYVESGPDIKRVFPEVRNGVHTARKGTPLTIACEASGFPAPNVTWTHRSENGTTKTYNNYTIQIDQLSIEHAGEYTCTADNANGVPAKFLFNMYVQSAPEIKTSTDIVNTAERYESELVCTVEAHPEAKVVWLKDGKEISGSGNQFETGKVDNNHILRLYGTKLTDFGEYICKAENQLGNTSKSIFLSGNPSKPIVKLVDKTEDMITFLEWELQSRASITQYELNYKRQENTNWTEEMLPPAEGTPIGNQYTVKHIFRELSPGTYQARLRAMNSYGWSPFSEIHSFPGINRLVKGERPQESHLLGEQLAELELSTESIFVESQSKYNTASQVRISLAFIFSLLCAHLLR